MFVLLMLISCVIGYTFAGPRMCIAHKFAVQEAALTLARLYRDFTFRLASDEPLKLRTGAALAPKDGLPVFVQKRAAAASS